MGLRAKPALAPPPNFFPLEPSLHLAEIPKRFQKFHLESEIWGVKVCPFYINLM